MIRSLWTAASGMNAQQLNVDTIANNLANVNTTGYKAETVGFKSLLYQNIQTRTTSANGAQKPVGAQVGLGVRMDAITSSFVEGSILGSDSNLDFAIVGNGFFGVSGANGEISYTRNGNFYLAQGVQGMVLTTSEGDPILDTQGEPIVFDDDIDPGKLVVDGNGTFRYPDENNNLVDTGRTIGIFQFPNPTGLEKTGSSLYRETAASGQVINEADGTVVRSQLKQKYLEGSNVQVANEMVNLITAQRAYELNSKAINASDEMMQQANNLRR